MKLPMPSERITRTPSSPPRHGESATSEGGGIVRALLALIVLCATASPAWAQDEAQPLAFELTYDESITDSYTGRVYVMLSANESDEPRRGPGWFDTQPFYAIDVTDWTPGETLRIGSGADVDAYPEPMNELPEGAYAVQAVMRRSPNSPEIGTGAGTAYSAKTVKKLDGATSGAIELHITEIVPERDPTENPRIKPMIEAGRLEHVRLRSAMLSAFHGRDIYHEAAVYLPEGYHDEDNAQRDYPALYMISGFGGDEFQAMFLAFMGRSDAADNIVKIGLDPLMRSGHHVFADSANNGPVGTALVEEFIPHLENKFRLVDASHGRFLTGISSGGWSSLWLQIQHPQFFGGVWSFVPDPVDFRAFQTVNIYADDANMYVDADGERRPLGRSNGKVVIWTDDFAQMEVVMDEGGQLHSFEAVFSPKGENGAPMPLYDRKTGAIGPDVAEAWKKYDINLVLKKRWDELAPHLQGKIHIIAGEDDNFYLEDAVKLLQKTLNSLGSDSEIEVIEGADHGSAMSPARLQRVDKELLEHFRAHQHAGAS